MADLIEGSVISDLTSLENDTDEFGRLLVQHQREELRLKEELSGSAKPFRQGRPRPLGLLTASNLKNYGSNTLHNGTTGNSRSTNSLDRIEPPLNVPRNWGAKARESTDWLRRMRHLDKSETPRDASREGMSSPDWVALASDIPIPSVDDSPLTARSASRRNTPGTAAREELSIPGITDWDASEELSAHSFLASTPAVWTRNTKLDDIHKREMEVESVSAAKARLARSRGTSDLPTAPTTQRDDPMAASFTHPAEQQLKTSTPEAFRYRTRIPRFPESTLSLSPTRAQGELALVSSTTAYGSVESAADGTSTEAGRPTVPTKGPRHGRQDSQDLLRRLVKATGSTSSPQPKPEAGTPPTETMASAEPEQTSGQFQEKLEEPQNGSDTRNPPETGNPPVETNNTERSATKSFARASRNRGVAFRDLLLKDDEANSNALPTNSMEDGASKLTRIEPRVPKTPTVTGAWIGTPEPQVSASYKNTRFSSPQKRNEMREKENLPASASKAPPSSRQTRENVISVSPSRSKRRISEPPSLPPSALAQVLSTSRNSYGDSTIDSLEAIMRPSGDNTVTSIPDLDAGGPTDNRDDLKGHPAEDDTVQSFPEATGDVRVDAERRRRAEAYALRDMNSRLRLARQGIRDAKRGIRELESQVEKSATTADAHATVSATVPAAVESVDKPTGSVSAVPPLIPTQDHCPHCRKPLADAASSWWLRLSSFAPLFSLFFIPTRSSQLPFRLTKLGFFALLFIFWLILEQNLCNTYCHPLYTHHKTTPLGIPSDAPEFPLVTFTLLWRTIHPALRPFTPIYDDILSPLLSPFSTLALVCARSVAGIHGLGPRGRDDWMSGTGADAYSYGMGYSPPPPTAWSSWWARVGPRVWGERWDERDERLWAWSRTVGAAGQVRQRETMAAARAREPEQLRKRQVRTTPTVSTAASRMHYEPMAEERREPAADPWPRDDTVNIWETAEIWEDAAESRPGKKGAGAWGEWWWSSGKGAAEEDPNDLGMDQDEEL